MNIDLITENEDGSADYSITLSNEEKEQLIRFAFIEMLKRGIKEGKEYDTSESGLGDTRSREQDCVYGPCFKSGKSELACICDQVTKVPY